jgi:hypothetical protein
MNTTTLNATIEKDILKDITNILADELFQMSVAKSRDTNELDLYDYHKTALSPGVYEITATQTVNVDTYNKSETYSNTINLSVDGPNKALSNADIYQIFPPKGDFGNYATFLPHIVLNKSTLPWELGHYSKVNDIPWLALILFDEDEAPNNVLPGQKIQVPADLLPRKKDLPYLAHVSRRNKPSVIASQQRLSEEDKKEKAVIIANRFPTPEKTNIVHLIALDEKANDNKYISLYNWSFTCEKAKDGLKHILNNLSIGPFQLPPLKLKESDNAKSKKIIESRNKLQKEGLVLLPHQTRMGQKIMSWYRGPIVSDTDFSESQNQNLVQKENEKLKISAINSSDQLLIFLKKTNQMNVTYAAAWELGKWMTLKNKEISIELFKWKRKLATGIKLDEQEKTTVENLGKVKKIEASVISMFKNKNLNLNDITLPDSIYSWLEELTLLRSIPFNYLVPDEKLLPEESIRFFTLDEGWIWAMIDGALSVGRNPTERKAPPFGAPQLHLSGCIMRSSAILQYPDLQIASKEFELLEKRLIGTNIWFCIFKETTQTQENPKVLNAVELFLPAEGMRFGGEIANELIIKELKEKTADGKTSVTIPFRSGEKERVISVSKLYKSLKEGGDSLTKDSISKSASFAYNMIQLSTKVIFKT